MPDRMTESELRDLLRYCSYFTPRTDYEADLRHLAERAAHELLAADPPHDEPNLDLPF